MARYSRADLAGRLVALTGAASGIGAALAAELARRGARLVLADRDGAGLATIAGTLGSAVTLAQTFDVTEPGALDGFAAACAEHGGADAIINNAGISMVSPFDAMPAADFDRVMAVNFDAVVRGTRAFLPQIKRAAATRTASWIVNISSVFGMIGFPTQSAYNASKFAVRGFTEALAIELGETDPAVRVVRVHPGGIDTAIARSAKFIAGMGPAQSHADSVASFKASAKTSAETAARVIADGMAAGRHRVLIGRDAQVIDWVTRLFPEQYEHILLKLIPDAPLR
jgi:NAD(P)-dependent dehydrogenase (short-subunit alcohol dehydrogenase family)